MRKRNTIRVVLVAVALSGAFLVLRSASPAGKDNPCKESLEECCKKKEAGRPDKTTWENLSRQFFSTI